MDNKKELKESNKNSCDIKMNIKVSREAISEFKEYTTKIIKKRDKSIDYWNKLQS